MKAKVCLSLLGAVSFVFADDASNVSARALFMTTAGSLITVENQQTNKSTEAKRKSLTAKKKNTTNTNLTKAEIPAGIEVKVYKIMEGNLEEINLKKSALKSGDEFFVGFRTNLPGFVEVINVTPDKRVNKLGVWQVQAFQEVKLPPEGNFKLTGIKGKEKLMLIFYPCKPVQTQTASTRDIVIAQSAPVAQVNSYVENSLPSCSYENNGVEYNLPNKKVVVSRDIVLTDTNKLVTYSSYEDGSNYYIGKFSANSIKPVVATIEILHK